jgi:hypothetical protein
MNETITVQKLESISDVELLMPDRDIIEMRYEGRDVVHTVLYHGENAMECGKKFLEREGRNVITWSVSIGSLLPPLDGVLRVRHSGIIRGFYSLRDSEHSRFDALLNSEYQRFDELLRNAGL